MMFGIFPFGLLSFFLPIIFLFVGFSILRRIGRYIFGKDDVHGYNDVLAYKDELEPKVYRIAQKYRGVVTLSDIILETGLSSKEAERLLENMTDGMRVRMEVDNEGTITYEFPEIMSRFKRFE